MIRSIYSFLFLFFSLTLCLVACGDLSGEYTGADKLPPDANVDSVGGSSALRLSASRFLMSGVAAGRNTGHGFRLRFELIEGRPLEFHFFASRKLTNGLTFVAERKAGKVHLSMSLNGKSHTKEFVEFENSKIIDIDVDVHNDHTDMHFLVWKHGGPYGDNVGCSRLDPNPTCLYNSAEFEGTKWFGVGQARDVYWGVVGESGSFLKLEGPLGAKSDA